MKKIVFIRHAKAEDMTNEISDCDRSLTESGQKTALIVCEKLIDLNIIPDLMFSSHSNRTLETAQIYANKYNFDINKIKIKSIIYQSFTIKELRNILKTVPNDVNTIFIFGHNPNLSYILSLLVNRIYEYLPKASASIVEFDVSSWNDISSKNSKLIDIKYAKK